MPLAYFAQYGSIRMAIPSPDRSGRTAPNLVQQPPSLEHAAFAVADRGVGLRSEQIVEQCVHGYEPAVLPGHPANQLGKAWLDPAILTEAGGKVHVEDAGATFLFEPVLCRLVEEVQAGLEPRTVAGCVPVVDVGPARIVVRHPRTHLQGVDVREHEIADVANPFPAQVAPESLILDFVPERRVPVHPAREHVVDQAMASGQPIGTPVNAFP